MISKQLQVKHFSYDHAEIYKILPESLLKMYTEEIEYSGFSIPQNRFYICDFVYK